LKTVEPIICNRVRLRKNVNSPAGGSIDVEAGPYDQSSAMANKIFGRCAAGALHGDRQANKLSARTKDVVVRATSRTFILHSRSTE
jgi:hypothetical protein